MAAGLLTLVLRVWSPNQGHQGLLGTGGSAGAQAHPSPAESDTQGTAQTVSPPGDADASGG